MGAVQTAGSGGQPPTAAGGVGAADAGAVAVPRNPSWLHVEDPPLLRSVPIRAGAGPWRRLRRPLWPAWRIWRAGEVPGETPGWRGSLPKVDAFGADPLPEGFGVDPLPSASSSSYGESFCSPGLGVDGTLVSCSFLKAAAGNNSWWRGCWWRGGFGLLLGAAPCFAGPADGFFGGAVLHPSIDGDGS